MEYKSIRKDYFAEFNAKNDAKAKARAEAIERANAEARERFKA